MRKPPKRIRVVHLVGPTFGRRFSGHTHYLYSLLSGWHDGDIVLDLYGVDVKPTNMNTGERTYRLSAQTLWTQAKGISRLDRIGWSARCLAMLLSHVRDFDIVHFHALNWGSLLCPLILHPLKKRVVFTMSLWGDDNPGTLLMQPRGRWQLAMLRHFDGAIGVGPALAEDARNHGLTNVLCLPNFLAIPALEESPLVDMRTYSRARLGIAPESRVLLFVGSMIRRKGVDLLIDAFIRVAAGFPDLLLLMVGPQSPTETTKIDGTYVAAQTAKLSQAGLDGRVRWTGMVRSQAELVLYYRSADLFVFPTRNEGSPNVILEAMAAGLPVVATRLPGITDHVVLDGITGSLTEPESSGQVAHAVAELLVDDEKRRAMAIAARQRVREKFSFDSYCRQLRAFYLDLMDIK